MRIQEIKISHRGTFIFFCNSDRLLASCWLFICCLFAVCWPSLTVCWPFFGRLLSILRPTPGDCWPVSVVCLMLICHIFGGLFVALWPSVGCQSADSWPSVVRLLAKHLADCWPTVADCWPFFGRLLALCLPSVCRVS
jgi:hypothetical protein